MCYVCWKKIPGFVPLFVFTFLKIRLKAPEPPLLSTFILWDFLHTSCFFLLLSELLGAPPDVSELDLSGHDEQLQRACGKYVPSGPNTPPVRVEPITWSDALSALVLDSNGSSSGY